MSRPSLVLSSNEHSLSNPLAIAPDAGLRGFCIPTREIVKDETESRLRVLELFARELEPGCE